MELKRAMQPIDLEDGMPNRAKSFCAHVGCNQIVSGRFCAAHAAEHEARQAAEQTRYNRGRGSAASQGYDLQWSRARLAYLQQHPLCEDCLEAKPRQIVPAVMVHHKIPIKTDRSMRLDPDNMRSLCQMHHERIEGPNRWKKRGTK